MRFTLRRMMVAVAVVAGVLAFERFLYSLAVQLVRETEDGAWRYIPEEALMVCVLLNAFLLIPIGLVTASVRADLKERGSRKEEERVNRK